MTVSELIVQLANDESCDTIPSQGLPNISEGLDLPNDVQEFYQAFAGAVLYRDADYAIEIVRPQEFVRANPVIVGEDCPEDISFDWFIIAKSGGQYVTIDLSQVRHGRCYDSFWDRHGVAGDCAIVAGSFTVLLERLMDGRGQRWYWLRDDYSPIGDAYDEQAL